jgi:hypothetical protein
MGKPDREWAIFSAVSFQRGGVAGLKLRAFALATRNDGLFSCRSPLKQKQCSSLQEREIGGTTLKRGSVIARDEAKSYRTPVSPSRPS